MADRPPYPGTGDDTGAASDGESTSSTPRWVKVAGITALAVVLLLVISLLTDGDHGPGRHASSGGLGGRTPTVSITAPGLHQP